jgi:hypothetical protein
MLHPAPRASFRQALAIRERAFPGLYMIEYCRLLGLVFYAARLDVEEVILSGRRLQFAGKALLLDPSKNPASGGAGYLLPPFRAAARRANPVPERRAISLPLLLHAGDALLDHLSPATERIGY